VDARSWSLLFNTVCLVAGSGALALPIGLALAWLVTRTDTPGRKVLGGVVVLVLFWPLYLHAAAWQAGFGLQGWYTLSSQAPVLLAGWRGAIWVHALAAVPWVVVIVGAALRAVDAAWEEQALLDGSAWQVFRHVTIRLTWPAAAAAALWTAIVAGAEMTVTDLFMVRTYAEELYTSVAVGMEPGELPLRAAPGVVLTALLLAGGVWVARRLAPAEDPPSFRSGRIFRLGPWRWPALLLAAGLLLLIVGVPMVNLLYKAGIVVEQTAGGRVRNWSPVKCASVTATSPWRYAREFGWSMAVGSIAASAAVALSSILAWTARGSRSVGGITLVLVAVGLATPGPVIGVSVIWLLNRPEVPWLVYLYDYSLAAPVLALAVRCFPVAALVLWHAYRWLPEAWLDALRLEGAGPLRLFVHLGLRVRWRALALAWLLAMVVAVGDLAASILVVPPGVTTLSIRIFGLLHYGVEDQVAGICLALAVLVGGVLIVSIWLVRRLQTARSTAQSGESSAIEAAPVVRGGL
jgi:iron(III) transport system permease protein